jgi:hypothetical protein
MAEAQFQHTEPAWTISIDQGGGYVVTKCLIGPYFTEETAIAEITRQQNLRDTRGLPFLPLGKVTAKPRDRFKPLPPQALAPMVVQLANAPGVTMLDDDDE